MIEWLRGRRGTVDRAVALGAYLSPRITNYWHPSLPARPQIAQYLAESLHSPAGARIPDQSPINWRAKAAYVGRRNAAGLPIDIRSGEVFVIDAAQFVLGLFDAGVVLSPVDRCDLADGLLELSEETRAGLRFRCFTPAGGGAVPSGWKSAMAQGQVASALLRLDRTEEAMAAVQEMCGDSDYVSVDMGGLALRECVHESAGVVLNGHLLALLGLYEVAVALPEMRPTLEQFLRDLPELVDRFITGSWSYYELGGCHGATLASAFYHRLHRELLVVWSILDSSKQLCALAQTCGETDSFPFRVEALLRRVAR